MTYIYMTKDFFSSPSSPLFNSISATVGCPLVPDFSVNFQ